MKVGLNLAGVQSLEMNESMLQATQPMGLDSLWISDHLLGVAHPQMWPDYDAAAALPDPDAYLDPFCLAAVLGRQTDLPLGTCVTDGTRRRGADLARTTLTLNNSCRGGFILGIGAGEAESLLPFGYDFTRPVGKLEETLKDLRSLLDTGRMPDGGIGRNGLPRSGAHGQAQIWVAAARERSLELAARYGDGWICFAPSLTDFASQLQQLDALSAKAARPHLTAAMMVLMLLGDSRAQIAKELERNPLPKLILLFSPATLWKRFGLEHPCGPHSRGTPDAIPHAVDPEILRRAAREIPFEMVEEGIFCGNAEEVAAQLQPYAAAGLQHALLADLTGLSYPGHEYMRVMGAQLPALISRLHEMQSAGR